MATQREKAIDLLTEAEGIVRSAMVNMNVEARMCACGSRRYAHHDEYLAAEAMRGICTKLENIRLRLASKASAEGT